MQMMGQVGAVAGITVAGSIVAAGSGRAPFTMAFLVAAIPALLGFVTAWFILSPSRGQAEPSQEPSALETANEQS